MKVHLVLVYNRDVCKIVDVYATRKAAEARQVRLTQQLESLDISYHVLTKPVLGLEGIELGVEGKQRFILKS